MGLLFNIFIVVCGGSQWYLVSLQWRGPLTVRWELKNTLGATNLVKARSRHARQELCARHHPYLGLGNTHHGRRYWWPPAVNAGIPAKFPTPLASFAVRSLRLCTCLSPVLAFLFLFLSCPVFPSLVCPRDFLLSCPGWRMRSTSDRCTGVPTTKWIPKPWPCSGTRPCSP